MGPYRVSKRYKSSAPVVNYELVRDLAYKLIKEIEASNAPVATEMCPLESLYNSRRKCDICMKIKDEPKFLYSSACSHIFCAECIEMAHNTYGRPYKCMMCRMVCKKFMHIVKEAERYRLKIHSLESQPPPQTKTDSSVSDNDDIASIILDDELTDR